MDAEIKTKSPSLNKSPLSSNPEKWSSIRETIRSDQDEKVRSSDILYDPPQSLVY